MKYPYAPRWVNILYAMMEFLDYKIIGKISNCFMNWRFELLDTYCKCPKCIKRRMAGRK